MGDCDGGQLMSLAAPATSAPSSRARPRVARRISESQVRGGWGGDTDREWHSRLSRSRPSPTECREVFRARSSSSHSYRLMPANATAFPEERMPRWQRVRPGSHYNSAGMAPGADEDTWPEVYETTVDAMIHRDASPRLCGKTRVTFVERGIITPALNWTDWKYNLQFVRT